MALLLFCSEATAYVMRTGTSRKESKYLRILQYAFGKGRGPLKEGAPNRSVLRSMQMFFCECMSLVQLLNSDFCMAHSPSAVQDEAMSNAL